MASRITGAFAVAAFSFAVLILLYAGSEAFNDSLAPLELPALAQLIFLASPINVCLLINPLLLSTLYWLLTADHPPSRQAVVWHILIVAFSMVLIVTAMAMTLFLAYMNGHVELTLPRIVVNGMITASLALACWRTFRANAVERKSQQGAAPNP